MFLCLETNVKQQHLESLQASLAIRSGSKNLIHVKILGCTIQPGNLCLFLAVGLQKYINQTKPKQTNKQTNTRQNPKELLKYSKFIIIIINLKCVISLFQDLEGQRLDKILY